MLKIIKKEFNASDVSYDSVSDNYYVTIYHGIGDTNYLVSVVDNSGEIRNTSNLFIKEPNDVLVNVPSTDIFGTWTVEIYYDDGSVEELNKKRLFEQNLIPAGDLGDYLSYRIAIGRPNTPTSNITLSDLKSFCQASLDSSLYLLKGNNLSDLNNVAAARQNLNVYDKNYIDNYVLNFIPKGGYISSVSSFVNSGSLTNPVIASTVQSMTGVDLYLTGTALQGEGDSAAGVTLGYIDITPVTGETISTTSVQSSLFVWFNSIFSGGQIVATATAIPGALRVSLKAYIIRPTGNTDNASFTASIHIPIILS